MKQIRRDSSASRQGRATRPHVDPVTLGTWLAVFSAFCYTASIMALRSLADNNDIDWAILVSCMKSVPVSLIAFAVVTLRSFRGQPNWPSSSIVLQLLMTGLFMQFAGNVAFQLGLSLGGMSLSLPLAYATMMLSGAVLGRVILGEPIPARSAAAMLALILSVAVLSVDAPSASQSVAGTTDVMVVVAAIATACLAGVGWGFPGVIVRRSVTGQLSVSMTVFLLSVTGVFGLGLTSLCRKGPRWMIDAAATELPTLLLAGVLNAMAFFALSLSLKHIPIVRVNLLNASQIAMAALAGVAFFGEAMTVWLIAGTVLTATGLIMMGRPQQQNQDSTGQSDSVSSAADRLVNRDTNTYTGTDTASPT